MKLKQKLIATILIVMMLSSYIATLTNVAIAVGEDLEKQTVQTNNANVEFNSYFEGEEHSEIFEIGKEAKLYLKLKVSNTGYLKSGVVQFLNANFEVNSDSLEHEKIQASSKDKINLKQINNGEEVIIEVPLNMLVAEKVDKDFLSKTSTARLTGTYVDENGREKSIEKEIKNQLNWVGTPDVELAGEVSKYLPYKIANEKGVMIQARIRSNLKDNLLPVEQTKLEVVVPEITIAEGNTVKPTRITAIANSTEATNGKGNLEFNEENYKYNEETNKLEIGVENKEEDGKITWNKKASDEYLVTFIYTGEEVYSYTQEKLAKAETTMLTEEEKKLGMSNENAITGEIEVEAKIVPNNVERKELTQKGKIVYNIEKAKGKLTNSSISTVGQISKGYIYANYDKAEKEAKKQEIEEKKETNYTVNFTAQIADKNLSDGIQFQTKVEQYTDKDGYEYNSRVYQKDGIFTKTIIVKEAVFTKILGTEGKIEILNKAGEELAEITNVLETDSNGNYVLDITEAKTNEITIKTSKPVSEGNIEIAIEKAISEEQEYTKEQMKKFESLNLVAVTTENENKAKINLVEPESKAEITINPQTLSTIVENKDVEIKAVLDTLNNRNALYKNPTLQIVLPENIEKLNINSTNLLLDDELKVKETKVVEQNGRKVIFVTLEGTQTKYMDNGLANSEEQANVISKGANIIIKADIIFKKLAPSANEKVYLYYTNQNTDLNMDGKTKVYQTSTDAKVVTPGEIITQNNMAGFMPNANIQNITDKKQVEQIETKADEKKVTVGGTIVSNFEQEIENVAILGRIPFEGNKDITTNQNLGSNFTMKMTDKITTSGIDESKIKVYYSANANATKELEENTNNWVTNPTSLSEIKSYLIEVDGKVSQGTQMNFNYNAELPENLPFDKSAYTTYNVYYNYKESEVLMQGTKEAGIIGLTTGEMPEVQLSVTTTAPEVREGQIVKMVATAKNTGDTKLENVKLLITAPEGTKHVEFEAGVLYREEGDKEKVFTIGEIKPGETIEQEYLLEIEKGVTYEPLKDENGNELKDKDGNTVIQTLFKYPGDKEIENIVRLTASNLQTEIKSEPYTFTVKEGSLTIINTPKKIGDQTFIAGDKLAYEISVENISYEKHLENVTIIAQVPEGMKLLDAYYHDENGEQKKDNITIDGNTIKINVGKLYSFYVLSNQEVEESGKLEGMDLLKDGYAYIELEARENAKSSDLVISATADGNLPLHYANTSKIEIEKVNLSIKQEEPEQKYIKEGKEFTYQYTIENIGKIEAIANYVEMEIPEGIKFVKASCIRDGKKINQNGISEGKININLGIIKPNEKIELSVKVRASLLPDKNDKEITTKANLISQGISKLESNAVKVIIEYDEEAHKSEIINSDNQTGDRKITGTAWLDANKDGKRDEEEELLANIPIILLNKSTSTIVKDEITGNEKVTSTDESGKYEITGIKPGEYVVVFAYDAGKYSVTDYQKEGISSSVNSDATEMRIVLNGEQRQVGITNTIKIAGENVRDIDIGLIVAERFDLRLDKYISKITVTTPSKGTKVYNYKNSKVTKCEIPSKDAGNSQVVIEYKIVVTNEGQIEGTAKKIIEYLPLNAKFSTELNKDWYIAKDNSIAYNSTLENQKIAPGESKEVKIILSFNINSKTIGKTINNNAEIYEDYNEQGLEDVDSIPANMLESEDDMSNADVILSVATGSIILYISLAFCIIVLLGISIYEIKKHIIKQH